MKNYKRKYYNTYIKYLIMFFIFFIFAMFILNIISKDKDFSERENRRLKSRPVFSMDNLLYNKFTSKYEKYIADQFFLRNSFIDIKCTAERMMLKKENNNVYFGDDDYLIGKFKKPNEDDISERQKAINNFIEKNEKLSKYIMLVPNKIRVLEDKLPAFAPTYDQLKYIDKFYSGLDKDIEKINVFNILNKNKDKYIYYKTDHHWTTKGAYYAYLQFCKSAKIIPKGESEYNVKPVSKDFYGTLQSRASIKNVDSDTIDIYLPKKEEDKDIVVTYIEEKKKRTSLYNSEKLTTKDKYSVFLNGNYSILKISTMSSSDKKLLVIKDSYANSFIPFLTSHFKDIIVVDLRYYTDDINELIKEYGITDALVLYNVNTFFEDFSILDISDYE